MQRCRSRHEDFSILTKTGGAYSILRLLLLLRRRGRARRHAVDAVRQPAVGAAHGHCPRGDEGAAALPNAARLLLLRGRGRAAAVHGRAVRPAAGVDGLGGRRGRAG